MGSPIPRCAGTSPLRWGSGPKGNVINLRKKYLPSRPKGFPLGGSCLRSRLKRCPRYTSFVYSDRRSYPSGDTSSDPLRGPPSPPRGRLLETAPLKLMTLARRADRASPRLPDKSGFACDSNSYNKLYNVCYTGSSRKPEIHFLTVFFDTITLYVSCFSLFTINHEGITKAIPSYCYRRKKSHIKHTHLHMLFRKGMDKREALLRGGQHAAGRADPVEGTL